CADERIPQSDVLDLISALADKSLVSVLETRHGATRYRLLNTVRQYASAKLAERAETVPVSRQHADYMLWLASASADAVHGPDAEAWMRQMEEAHPDLTAALNWSRQVDSELCLRLATAAALFWEDRGYLTHGREW